MAELVRVHEASSLDAVQVVFIHGLGGDSHGTWMSNDKDYATLWPKWLGEDTNCTVWLLSYDAALSGWTGDAMHLADQGVALMSELAYEKTLHGKRLVLVGHSLGGLVIKAGMMHAFTHNAPLFASALNSISAIVFIGTPHQGASLATVASVASGLLRTNPQVRNMQQNDGWLKSLNGQFQKIQRELEFAVYVFFETHKVLIGRSLWKFRLGKRVIIVDRNSSDPQIPMVTPVPLAHDHIRIAKPKNRNATLYKAMLHVIVNASSQTRSPPSQSNAQRIWPTDIGGEVKSAPAEPVMREVKSDKPALTTEQLRQLAQKLLESGLPSSVMAVFPDATAQASQSLKTLSKVERFIIEAGNGAEHSLTRYPFQKLTNLTDSKHLVVAAPGSGKTLALWQVAAELISDSELIPLFLPVGDLSTWDQVKGMISDVAPDISPDEVLRDNRVCVCLDGWSEFATGVNIGQRSKALRVLQGVLVIANARNADAGDSAFKIWKLEPIPLQAVSTALAQARPGSPEISENLLDLLRLPLMFSLFVLSGKNEGSAGALLQDFHARLTRNIPEKFNQALSLAVATTTLLGDRSYSQLTAQLRRYANELDIPEPVRLLESLGSITNRAGQAVPVHDLYWSWLCGCGLLQGVDAASAITRLSTRESYILALQSNEPVSTGLVEAAVGYDWLLAVKLHTESGSGELHPAIVDALEHGFSNPRLAVRERAAIASLLSRNPKYISQALQTLSDLHGQLAVGRIWVDAFDPTALFPLRGVIAKWVGSPGTNYLLESIAEKGTSQWVAWLEQMAIADKITWDDATATALACSSTIPAWGYERLHALLRDAPWKLRKVALRRSNLALATLIASEYNQIIEQVVASRSSGWIDINRVILDCGNDQTLEQLLIDFRHMTDSTQELLGFAVVDKGGQWIAKFQKAAFSVPKLTRHTHHHKLAKAMSLDIDDETARQWIANGYGHSGWRVLIARHGVAMLPELTANMPSSFSGIDYVPELEYIAYLQSAPASLAHEIWSRVDGQMQPKTTQDVLLAAAVIKPIGMFSIAEFLVRAHFSIPAYYLLIVLQIYADWQKDTGQKVHVEFDGNSLGLDQCIVISALTKAWDEHYSPRILAKFPDLAIESVLDRFSDDESRQEEILTVFKVRAYHDDLFNAMLARPRLAKLIPDVFGECFETFPEVSVMKAIQCESIDQIALCYRLSKSSNPLHRCAHSKLIVRALQGTTDVAGYRQVANCLRSHPRYDLINLLRETIFRSKLNAWDDKVMWFIREVECVRSELLITEAGEFIA
jgi:pimeloyl-ACP methyl ester carboxylesterase